MIRVNKNYSKLQASYLFSNIAKRVAKFQEENPDRELIKLGIGDVTKPLPSTVIDAFHSGVDDMADENSFKGYGPEQGYAFLREAIAAGDFQSRGCNITAGDVFVSDGAKCDTGNFQELFADDAVIAVPDPVYPVYVDTNVMAGRTGQAENGRYQGIIYLESTEKNGYVPMPSAELKADLVYLCFPNNPTGATATKAQLKSWVDWALENKALILFDAAYVSFIRDEELPHSIFEIEGARKCCVEFRSFSKNAGFTGTRCGYVVLTDECTVYDEEGQPCPLKPLWNRRHTTKFNGTSYPVQKAAAAVYTPEGQKQVRELTDYYLENAKIIREGVAALGYDCVGGDNSPYIWVKSGMDSWEAFDLLLNKAGVVITPGSGFGKCGEGYFRISAFNDREKVIKAMEKIKLALS
ncbi:MAG: LL-diaminopimelate aminotransferase [Spirochaetales bacterium]|nr:LL-diaminopimelate aminotransferase [Spirochaetales bacterium]